MPLNFWHGKYKENSRGQFALSEILQKTENFSNTATFFLI
jgi:hypothetical protein